MRKLIDRLSMKGVRRLVVAVVGSTVVLVGVIFLFTPGQGLLTIYAGLAILASEFLWARALLHKVRDRVRSAVNSVKGQPAASSGTTVPATNPEQQAAGLSAVPQAEPATLSRTKVDESLQEGDNR